MDFTKKNRIRDKDFNKIALKEYGLLYRKDSESIFLKMIAEKDLNHTECVVVRTFTEEEYKQAKEKCKKACKEYYS